MSRTYISPEDRARIARMPPPKTFTYYRGKVPVSVTNPIAIEQFLYNYKFLGKPATDYYYYWMERCGVYLIIIKENILWYIGKSMPERVEGLAARTHEHVAEQIGRPFAWLLELKVSFHDMTAAEQAVRKSTGEAEEEEESVITSKERELIHNGPKPLGNYDNEDWQAKTPLGRDIVLPIFGPAILLKDKGGT